MSLKRCLAALLVLVFALSAVPAFAYSMPYYIHVDLTNQIVTVYNTKDNSIARQMLCSAGTGSRTPTGEWYMPDKDRDDERTEWYWMPNAYTWVKYATKIYYAYFFHSIPYNDNVEGAINETALAQFGNPASHGCIRLREEDAYFIATECLKGTYVKIFRSGERDDNLRALLYESSFSQDDQTYAEFLGISGGDLGRGSAGSAVTDLQHRLNDLGYSTAAPDGVYGTETMEAVEEVQKDLGLLPTGICSEALQETLFSDSAPVRTGKTTVSEGQSGPIVEKLQLALQELGIYSGAIDSIYDADVAQAVATFQRLCGLTQNGVASPEIQHAIYYVLNKIHTQLGKDFTVEQVTEEIVYGTLKASANIVVRKSPNTESDRLGVVEDGQRILVAQVQGDWAQIVNGSSVGYIYKKYLTKPETEQSYTLKYSSASGSSLTLGTSVKDLANSSGALLKEIQASYSSGAAMDYLHETGVEYATVNTGDDTVKLNMRAAASSESTILDMAENGMRMRVLEKGEDWTKVVCNGQIAYLMTGYLSFDSGAVEDETSAIASQRSLDGGSAKATVKSIENAVGAKVYIASDVNSSVYMHAPANLQVNVLDVNNDTGWALIGYENNYGFMKIEHLTFA